MPTASGLKRPGSGFPQQFRYGDPHRPCHSGTSSIDAKIDFEKLLSRHFAVVGSTGKSTSVTLMLCGHRRGNGPTSAC
ncbi:MAG: ATP-binding protein [Phyllobacteriaceae bacterium]|nr:ATP-binding protein [Phyllobacteriaceae bacterium]